MLRWREERKEDGKRKRGGRSGESLSRLGVGEGNRKGKGWADEREREKREERGEREKTNLKKLRRMWSPQSRLKSPKSQPSTPGPPAPLLSRPQDGNYKAKSSGEVTRFYQPAAPNARGAGAAAAGLCDSCPLSKGGLGPSERHPNNCLLILARLYFGIYYSLSRQIPL